MDAIDLAVVRLWPESSKALAASLMSKDSASIASRGRIDLPCHHTHAVVNAIANTHIKPPRLTKQGFVTREAAAVAVAGGLFLEIRLRLGDFQESCHSLAAIQAAWIKGSAMSGSGSSVGLFIHTSAG